MRVAKRLAVWVGAFALVAFTSVEIVGHVILSRNVEPADSLVPLEFFRAADSGQQWEIITAAMEAGPDGGYTLTNTDIERAKELVFVALTCAPEEWEGSGRISSASATIRFLEAIYPGVKEGITQVDSHIRLEQLRELIFKHPPQRWRVVLAGLFGEW